MISVGQGWGTVCVWAAVSTLLTRQENTATHTNFLNCCFMTNTLAIHSHRLKMQYSPKALQPVLPINTSGPRMHTDRSRPASSRWPETLPQGYSPAVRTGSISAEDFAVHCAQCLYPSGANDNYKNQISPGSQRAPTEDKVSGRLQTPASLTSATWELELQYELHPHTRLFALRRQFQGFPASYIFKTVAWKVQ